MGAALMEVLAGSSSEPNHAPGALCSPDQRRGRHPGPLHMARLSAHPAPALAKGAVGIKGGHRRRRQDGS